ncbi:GRIP and coiled-coil domain-containing protein 1-like [Patiria miniata]|uniref:GRIP domain-containing protein n=1 Tax=Patiria miniata TaxID=46514 RepID=A0A914BF90_PATMI|nr:GRIP and coiled-coil domain-containing protein 1-like [Patiria miniata]XP_038074749.1 GRIP and coiled-coil domain-containing protein 1-like [Patiria miniata]XP_038074750.1 GRIP and coiled-coil domain-containing protein 1-like [Patiria miniata]
MDRGTRKDLLETIEKQKDQLSRYESRLRDVVQAYKNLSKEKEALEASVQALSATSPQKPVSTPQSAKPQGQRSDREGEARKDDDNESVDSQSTRDESKEASDTESTEKEENVNFHQLKEQLSTLTTALATVTAQKSKMEASFQADKKKIRQEFEESLRQHQEGKEQFEEAKTALQEQLTEARNKSRLQQQEREQEQIDHAVMIRELQTLLAQERNDKERLENKLGDLEDGLAIAKSQPDKSAAYEEHVRNLNRDLEAVRSQLRAAEQKASRPSPLLVQLQKEMAEMKAQHRIQVEAEQQKAKESKEVLRQLREAEEERVATLESKLAELSEVVGNYDRVKQQDQQAIQRLKERITQLDLENTALAQAINKSQTNQSEEIVNPDATVSELTEKITTLKGLLKLANQKSEKPVDIDDICNIEDHTSLEIHPDHRSCQQELKQLKDEFERYKLRAQGVLKNKSVKDTSSNKEIEALQTQLTEMRDRISVLRQQLDDEEASHKQTVTNYEDKIFKLKEQHRAALSQAESEYKQRASDMEQQIHRQRDRTMALLAEKAQEIDILRQQLNHRYGGPANMQGDYSLTRQSSGDVFLDGDERPKSEADETVSQLQVSMVQSSNPSLLHFADERARREVELTAVKKQKQQLEGALRQLQEKHAMAAQMHEEELDQLREEAERWKRNRSREGTNLEYLKNVVLCYFQTESHSKRRQMFSAIATILQFTRREKEGVLKKQGASWWGYGPT